MSTLINICTSGRNIMKQLEVTQLWNKTQRQLRADEFQIPLFHKYLAVIVKSFSKKWGFRKNKWM